nr:hypothetical protein CFP56_12511 [Quercus suber]
MASSDQDILKKMEEMKARMTAPIIERLHHLEGAQGKKKVMQEPQDEDSIFDDDFEEKEAEINKEPKKREKSKETKEMSKEIEKMIAKGVMKPLDLGRYTPNTSAPNYNAIEYYKYHQSHGHSIDKCTRLHHDIEDLIQFGKVLGHPSTSQNQD